MIVVSFDWLHDHHMSHEVKLVLSFPHVMPVDEPQPSNVM